VIRVFAGVTSEDIENEVQAVTKLCHTANAHDNIITMFEHGPLPPLRGMQSYFFDMEFCEKTLQQHINDLPPGAFTLGQEEESLRVHVFESAKIAHDITNGLEFIHRHGAVHRDLKPENGKTSSST
jgi:serine/threonine protein kinase